MAHTHTHAHAHTLMQERVSSLQWCNFIITGQGDRVPKQHPRHSILDAGAAVCLHDLMPHLWLRDRTDGASLWRVNIQLFGMSFPLQSFLKFSHPLGSSSPKRRNHPSASIWGVVPPFPFSGSAGIPLFPSSPSAGVLILSMGPFCLPPDP